MRTMQDLQQLQGLPLSLKIRMTKERIRQWINEYGEDGVYVTFSGGKDSTVLLHLVNHRRFLHPKGSLLLTLLRGGGRYRMFRQKFPYVCGYKKGLGFPGDLNPGSGRRSGF